ncbi:MULTISPECIES: carbohydrate ABC transporter permease [Paenibacillus]|uniref:Putative aldouronate transport system permease protein n=1 Tax=Paenibacillus prosopidis TaxID=630520 RepID=A0A368VIM1_9BACL|nr:MULTISPECIES: carbohydrate ABC transporter permease [Paenibacillus]RCW41135.1 putative aldouronate transport system permease protein [Paenibacillus prosopidis]
MVQNGVRSSRTFQIVNISIMVILVFLAVYPFFFSIINSLNDGTDLRRGPVLLWPRVFRFDSWEKVLSDSSIIKAGMITLSRTIIVTVIQIFNTALFTYAFSRPYLKYKKFYVAVGFASMYFPGALIPTFLLYNWLGIYDTYWVYITPILVGSFFNVIIFNANYKAIPESLFESAKMDGANEFRIFFSIVLPLSKSVIAAISVFVAVWIWNDYGTTLFFTQNTDLQTIQYYILKLIMSNAGADQVSSAASQNADITKLINQTGIGRTTAETIQLAAMVIASIPMIIMYPFTQKFFIKGVMLGSVKG